MDRRRAAGSDGHGSGDCGRHGDDRGRRDRLGDFGVTSGRGDCSRHWRIKKSAVAQTLQATDAARWGPTCRCHFGRWSGCGDGVGFTRGDGAEAIDVYEEPACDGSRIVGLGGGSRRRWIVAGKVRIRKTLFQIAFPLIVGAV